MKNLLVALLFIALPAPADLLPEALAEFARGEVTAPAPANPELYDEFGLQETERSIYSAPDGRKTEVTAQRFYDDTGAFSAFRHEQTAQGEYSGFGERSWTDGDLTLIHFANYLVRIDGDMPTDTPVEAMLTYFPQVAPTPDPPVLAYVPKLEQVPATQRHILGPVGLAESVPELSPSTVGFHFGAEAHYSEYQTEDGPQRMAIFYYPTIAMAREQVEQFYAVDGVTAKRTGPLIAAVIGDAPDAAQRLISKVRYEAQVTPHYDEPKRSDDLTTVVLDTFVLVAILAALFVLGGVFVAGTRFLAARVAPSSIFAAPKGDGMTRLEIDEEASQRLPH